MSKEYEHTLNYYRKKRNQLLNKLEREQKSALSDSKVYSKYRTDASKEFYKNIDLSQFKKKKGDKKFTEDELKSQIEDLKNIKADKLQYLDDYRKGNILSNDTVIAWSESNLETDAKNTVFMQDITNKWLERGYSNDDDSSAPTWIEVFSDILDIGPDGTATVGDLRSKLNERGLDKEDKDLIRTLLNQIERDTYHSKGRI